MIDLKRFIRDHRRPVQPPASHSIQLNLDPEQAERVMAILLDAQASNPEMPPEAMASCLSAACQIQRQLKAVPA